MDIFQTEASLAAAHLPLGLLVRTLGEATVNDGEGKEWIIEAVGTGVTLANGYVAIVHLTSTGYGVLTTEVLASGQTEVSFLGYDVSRMSFKLEGSNVDNTDLLLVIHYTITDETTIELVQSYPAGTNIHALEAREEVPLLPDPSEYILKAGDTMTGILSGIDPVSNQDLTTKEYVDSAIAAIPAGLTVTAEGSNANGYYIKYSNGLIEQWLFRSQPFPPEQTWVFPIAFTNPSSLTFTVMTYDPAEVGGVPFTAAINVFPTTTQVGITVSTDFDGEYFQAKGY